MGRHQHERSVSPDGIIIHMRDENQTTAKVIAHVPVRQDFMARIKKAPLEEVMFAMRSRVCRLGFHLEGIKFDFEVNEAFVQVRGNIRAVVQGYPSYGRPISDFFELNPAKKKYPVLGRLFHRDPKKLVRAHDLNKATQGGEKLHLPKESVIDHQYDRVLIPLERVTYQFDIMDEAEAIEQIRGVCSRNMPRTDVEQMKYQEKSGVVEIPPGEGIISAIRLKSGPYFAVIDEHCDPFQIIHLPALLIDPGSPYAGHNFIHVELLNTGETTVINPRIPVRFYRP